MFKEHAFNFLLGVTSSIVAELLLRPFAANGGAEPAVGEPRRAKGGLLLRMLTSTSLAIGALLITRYRWVVEPAGVAAIVLGTLFGSIALLWGLQRFSKVFHRVAFAALTLATVAAFVTLDAALPRFVTLDCSPAVDGDTLLFTGRVLDPDAELKIQYGPAGRDDHHTMKAPPAGPDGVWRASINVDGVVPPGRALQVVALTSTGTKSRVCTFNRPARSPSSPPAETSTY